MRAYEDFETYFSNEVPSEFLSEDQEFHLKIRNEINELLELKDKRNVLVLNEQIKELEERDAKLLRRIRNVIAASLAFYGFFGNHLDESVINVLFVEIGVLAWILVTKDILSSKADELKSQKSSIIQKYVDQDLLKDPAILETFKDIGMSDEEILEFLFLSDFCQKSLDNMAKATNLNTVRTRKDNKYFDKR